VSHPRPARADRPSFALRRRVGLAVALLVSVAVPTIGGLGSPASAATMVDFGPVR